MGKHIEYETITSQNYFSYATMKLRIYTVKITIITTYEVIKRR